MPAAGSPPARRMGYAMNSDGAAGSDRAIIERGRHGEIHAFANRLTRYRAWVFAIVRKHVPANRAEELAHDISVEAVNMMRVEM